MYSLQHGVTVLTVLSNMDKPRNKNYHMVVECVKQFMKVCVLYSSLLTITPSNIPMMIFNQLLHKVQLATFTS